MRPGTKSDVSIRVARASDAPGISDAYLASRRHFVAAAPLRHSEAEIRGWVQDLVTATGSVAVATEGGPMGRVVGMLATARESDCGWIEQLYLHPEVVGQGYGRQLLEWAKGELGPPIRLYTFQFNKRSRRFYEREGFEVVAYRDGSQNEERCPDVLYEWRG